MKQLLIVDDDETACLLIEQSLVGSGVEITVANDSFTAIDILTNSGIKFDLMLLDIHLEVVNARERTGFEVLAESKTKVPFVVLTSSYDEKFVNQAERAGVLGYIVKPIEIHRLLPQIKIAFQQASEHKKKIKAIKNNYSTNVLIGIMMERLGIGKDDAFNQIRSHCRSSGVSISDYCNSTIEKYEKANGRIDVAVK